ncbi:hypothetical protein Ahy_A03g011423 isoform C [Arachis hypogaea]|uniref:Uncharacterized protein n=1 Tax=Arachis hypogaea TaxID=3818 RepID=A0A445DQP7_ARAHY|nr:hypothetical protein Ahy_A03g011423 isoform C [Arachis hypogaea]
MRLPYACTRQRCPDQAWNTRLRQRPRLRRRRATPHTRPHRPPHLRFRCFVRFYSLGFLFFLYFVLCNHLE